MAHTVPQRPGAALFLLFLALCQPMALRASAPHEVEDGGSGAVASAAELQRIIAQLQQPDSAPQVPSQAGRDLLQVGFVVPNLQGGVTAGLALGFAGPRFGSGRTASITTTTESVDANGTTTTTRSTADITTAARDYYDYPYGQIWRNVLDIVELAERVNKTKLKLKEGPFTDKLFADGVLSGNKVRQLLDLPTDPMDPGLEAVVNGTDTSAAAVATLGLLSGVFNLVSSILYTVSGGLGTAAASLGLIPAGLGTITGPLGFGLSSASFGLTLSQDEAVDASVQRWQVVVNQLADRLEQLSSGSTAGALTGYRGQIGQALGLLQSVQARFNPSRQEG
ncbi:hypothetical protein V8C86DRAFT_2999277 [Haematococcus lacustris]